MNAPVLVAVSGGGDSVALLHRLSSDHHCHAVTVDHGLRPDAAREAKQVAAWCAALGIPHRTIRLDTPPANAQAARLARYQALAAAAGAIGAKRIALGHTLDDQAETVLMRALRAQPDSGVIGLSGMAEQTAYDDLMLWRPMLGERRAALRDFLQDRGADWIDDPSNEDGAAERVRARRALAAGLADPVAIAQLASLAQRDRAWLSRRCAGIIETHAGRDGDGLVLTPPANLPRRLLREVFSVLTLSVGGTDHRPRAAALEEAVAGLKRGERFSLTIGRSLIAVADHAARFSRESRHVERPPHGPVAPFARFRPSWDDPIREAMKTLLS